MTRISKPQQGWGGIISTDLLPIAPGLAWPRAAYLPQRRHSREMKVCRARLLGSWPPGDGGRGAPLRPKGKSAPSFPQLLPEDPEGREENRLEA